MDKPSTKRSSGIRHLIQVRFLSGSVLRRTKHWGKRVLDLGCGWGFYFDINPEAYGVDLDDACIVYLQSRGYKAIKADITQRLPFAEGSFECIVCNNVLEHFELSDTQAILQEVHRLLAPQGMFVILIPNRRGYDFGCCTNAGHKHFITPKEISELSKSRFRLLSHYSHPFPHSVGEYFTHNNEVMWLQKI